MDGRAPNQLRPRMRIGPRWSDVGVHENYRVGWNGRFQSRWQCPDDPPRQRIREPRRSLPRQGRQGSRAGRLSSGFATDAVSLEPGGDSQDRGATGRVNSCRHCRYCVADAVGWRKTRQDPAVRRPNCRRGLDARGCRQSTPDCRSNAGSARRGGGRKLWLSRRAASVEPVARRRPDRRGLAEHGNRGCHHCS